MMGGRGITMNVICIVDYSITLCLIVVWPNYVGSMMSMTISCIIVVRRLIRKSMWALIGPIISVG